jgi:hypothetical protein
MITTGHPISVPRQSDSTAGQRDTAMDTAESTQRGESGARSERETEYRFRETTDADADTDSCLIIA